MSDKSIRRGFVTMIERAESQGFVISHIRHVCRGEIAVEYRIIAHPILCRDT